MTWLALVTAVALAYLLARVCLVPKRQDAEMGGTNGFGRLRSNVPHGTILLVEEDVALRTALQDTLEENGYNVIEASNAAEAAMAVRSQAGLIHLVIAEVDVPGMSRREIAERLGINRVLYLSSYALEELTVQILQKPFTAEALLKKVREAAM